MRLRIKIKKLEDHTFEIKYYWHLWENTHYKICSDIDELTRFVKRLVAKTEWKT